METVRGRSVRAPPVGRKASLQDLTCGFQPRRGRLPGFQDQREGPLGKTTDTDQSNRDPRKRDVRSVGGAKAAHLPAPTGHLKWKGTLMCARSGKLLESAPKTSVLAFPYVHGGSGLMTSCECLRHTRKNMWQSRDGERQTLRELVKESTLSSKTPADSV